LIPRVDGFLERANALAQPPRLVRLVLAVLAACRIRHAVLALDWSPTLA
jgi:hypothetical protein